MDMEDMTLSELSDACPNAYRECARRFLPILHAAVSRMPDSVEKWGIAFATANPCCMGQSMSEIAKRLGVSRATLSHEARKFCEENNLQPSTYMKSESAVRVATEARRLAVHIRTTIETRKNER